MQNKGSGGILEKYLLARHTFVGKHQSVHTLQISPVIRYVSWSRLMAVSTERQSKSREIQYEQNI